MNFDYESMNLIPKKCIVNSRSECDTSVKFGPHTKFDFRDLARAMRELDSLAEEAVSCHHFLESSA